MKKIFGGKTGLVLLLLVALLLAGLPVAVWLDHQQRAQLLRQQRGRPHSRGARRAHQGGA
jgi:hypothetical protein